MRLLVHDAIERTELAPISLKEEVNAAFSVIRTAINAAVTAEHLRDGCLEAVEDCENKCRQRLTTLHAQHLSFLQELVGHENEPDELSKSWAKRKSAEFDEITRIPDLRFMTDYPKIPAGTVTPDFGRNRPLTPAWQKERVHMGRISGKKHEFSAPRPWDSRLPGAHPPRASSAHPPLGEPALAHGRPASSLGLARPRTPSAEAMVGVKTIVIPHAIPHLKHGSMPTGLEHWPARTSTLQSSDAFEGEGTDTGDVVPARGYLKASSRFNACLQTGSPSPLEAHTRSSRRPVTAKPKEMEKIERFIDVEFKKSRCQLDEFNAQRLAIFRRAFNSISSCFTSWAPLLKTIQREYETYIEKVRVWCLACDLWPTKGRAR